jgi:hypothetical protein
VRILQKKKNKTDERIFDVFRCTLPTVARMRKVVLVLAKDMQSALSTVPESTTIERLEGQILINKRVARDIAKLANKGREP